MPRNLREMSKLLKTIVWISNIGCYNDHIKPQPLVAPGWKDLLVRSSAWTGLSDKTHQAKVVLLRPMRWTKAAAG